MAFDSYFGMFGGTMIAFMLEGGPFTWAVLALLLCGGFLTLVRAGLSRHVDYPGAGLCLAGLAIGLGLLGTFQGWRMAFMAVAAASPEMKAELIQVGIDLGWSPTTLAVIGVVVLAPLNGIALARSRDRATWIIKALGWVSGSLAGLVTLLALAVAVWLSGSMVSMGAAATGDALAAAAAAQTISWGLMAGMFLSLLALLLGLGGGLTLMVAGTVSGVRNRKKHLGDDDET
jgi:hypothetical protein